ncbi:MAG: 30S ribosomal protein S27ae [Thermoplasmata archaeon]
MAKAAPIAKARVGLYLAKGTELTRTHKFCPKCGSGTFLAEHADRRSCGRCGYMESKSVAPSPPAPTERPKGRTPKATPAPA